MPSQPVTSSSVTPANRFMGDILPVHAKSRDPTADPGSRGYDSRVRLTALVQFLAQIREVLADLSTCARSSVPGLPPGGAARARRRGAVEDRLDRLDVGHASRWPSAACELVASGPHGPRSTAWWPARRPPASACPCRKCPLSPASAPCCRSVPAGAGDAVVLWTVAARRRCRARRGRRGRRGRRRGAARRGAGPRAPPPLFAAGAPLPPPAAFSNSARCERNSINLARIAGSIAVTRGAAPGVPVAGAGAGDSSALFSPTSAVRLPCSLVYDERQSVFVVISSLKLLINCDTCVRASPDSCAAAGSCVSWLRVSRAAVR